MAGVRRLSPVDALTCQQSGARLIDVRSESEQATGMANATQAIAQDALLEDAATHVPRNARIVLICQRGSRSLMVAESMLKQGFMDVASVEGGIEAWRHAGLPMTEPTHAADFLDRYSRQLRLPQVGIDGQQKLQQAGVTIVGAGGLGAPAAFYLAAAGVGHLRLVDDDIVERSNLHRQILHVDAGVGIQTKVDSARTRLLALNPTIDVDAVCTRVVPDNVDALVADADVVLDGADNFAVRHLLNDACLRLRKPLVYGAVHRFEGQASVFDAGRQRGIAPCYRCLFPEAPDDAPNCAEAGVLGIVPGIIGLVQASEAIKLILGIGQPLTGRLLRFDALTMRFRETRLPVDTGCPACASRS